MCNVLLRNTYHRGWEMMKWRDTDKENWEEMIQCLLGRNQPDITGFNLPQRNIGWYHWILLYLKSMARSHKKYLKHIFNRITSEKTFRLWVLLVKSPQKFKKLNEWFFSQTENSSKQHKISSYGFFFKSKPSETLFEISIWCLFRFQ